MVDAQQQLVSLMLDGDRMGSMQFVDDWAAIHGFGLVMTDLIEPVLTEIGARWAVKTDVNLAEGYVTAKIVEEVMTRVIDEQSRQQQPSPGPGKGPVVIGNIEEDCHALGRKLVGIFLKASGWEVHDLGNDVTPERFVEVAVQYGARIIGASAMMYTTAVNIRKLRDEIDGQGLRGRIQLAVGGAVFVQRPELVDEVGGDGTARNAILVPPLLDRLWSASETYERGRS